MNSLLKITKQISIRYLHVLLVLLAFAMMVISSYLFVSETESRHLRRSAKNAILYTEATIKSDMLELETLLGVVSETIGNMLKNGEGIDAIKEYIVLINNYVDADRDRRLYGATGIFGVFDVFDGLMLIGYESWVPPENYYQTNRPWYTGAIKAAGEISITDPYLNVYSNRITITLSRQIFDEDGNALGIICLNIELTRIAQYAVSTQFVEGGYGFLLSENFMIIAHPNSAMVGLPFRNIKSGIAALIDEFEQKGSISEVVTTDYQGLLCIVFVQRLQNGWYMGIVTPRGSYFQSTRILAITLTVFGAIFAALLISMLLKISIEKAITDERMQIMFNATPLVAYIFNQDFKVIDCNQKAVTLFDLSSKQEFCERYYDLLPEYQPNGRLSADLGMEFTKKTLEEGSNCFEWVYKKLNGELIPCEITCTRVMHKNDLNIVGYMRDLREQRKMEERTQDEMRKAEIAEESNKAKSDFLARMSHEIRTPMNAILGIAEIQLQDETHPSVTKEAFERISNSGDLLLGIINDILDLSKIEAGKLVLTPLQYDLASMIYDTTQLNILRYETKPIKFVLEVKEDLPLLLIGDELRIKQILNNLLSNAFKYTEKGTIKLTVSAEPADPADTKAASKKILVFIVSDTGQGMTAEQVQELGTVYSRFNMEANRKTEGTGLGMNITQNLIHLMNGSIAVESTPGKGSTFTVRLPQDCENSAVIGKEIADNLMELTLDNTVKLRDFQMNKEYMPYGRVLVVDDVETNLYVARGLIAPYGISVETASSGFEAIEKIKAGLTYDIVFMDHMMPEMDGIEAVKIIRDLGYSRPIVALTANALAGQAAMFLDNGFDDFISKPIDMRHLNMTLNKLIRDKYPAEVVEAAKKQKEHLYSGGVQKKSLEPELAEIFIRDARKALTILEAIYLNNFRRDADLSIFIINIHAMKSALANVGETALAANATNLEQAGRENNVNLILSELPSFLEMLRNMIKKIEPKDIAGSNSGDSDDNQYLKEKLLALKEVCVLYDKKIAKNILAEIRKKTWSKLVNEQLSDISLHLLHSDFNEAVQAIDGWVGKL